MRMAVPVTDVVSEAKQVIISQSEIWSIIVAFVFGSFTSAIWTWKEGHRKASAEEIVSTALSSGMLAILFVCLLLRFSPGTPMVLVLAVSILSGFSGDIMVRPAVKWFGLFVARLTGNILPPNETPKNHESDTTKP